MLYNTIAGIDDVDPVALETHRAFGFSRLQAVWMVSPAERGPVHRHRDQARLVGRADPRHRHRLHHRRRSTGPGIGAYISQESTGADNLTVILAATVWAGILGLVLDLLLTMLQRRLLRWHHARLGETE